MSVIYKTLKKLKTESAEDPESKRISKKGKRRYPFKEASLNPVMVISIVLLMFIAGIGIFFAVRSLNKTDSYQPQPKVFPISQNSENLASDESFEEKGKKTSSIRYLPAEAIGKSAQDTTGKDSKKTRDALSPGYSNIPKIAAQNTIENQPSDGKQPGFENPGQYSSPVKATFSPKISEEKRLKEKVRTQRIHRTNLERSLKISRLIDNIHKHIKAGNIGLTEKLLAELEAIKGKDNTYVLKLRAFWCMNREDYESAAGFLKKVLDKNERDLEAGMNMAIVEIKTKRIQQAEERLQELSEIYPENKAISVLIKKLKYN